jgi:Na+-driven multidrug efflux pump
VHHPGILLLLLMMTAAAVLDIWDVPLEPLLAALGRARQLFRGRLAGMLLSLPLLYFLARIWGVDGAAWGVLAGEVVIFLTRLIPFLRMGSARR